MQVTGHDAKLLADANTNAELVLNDGMNHVIKQVGDDLALNQQSYVAPGMPIDSTLISEIVSFLDGNLC